MFSLVAVAWSVLACIVSVTAFTPGFPYGSQKVRGVNLGGWLLLEAWMTPSLFDNTGDNRIMDEYTFCQYQDRNMAANTLRRHWDTWFTEGDFIAIANAGLNHVRIPIGYWAFDVSSGEPYIQGQIPYPWKAVDWAQRHNIKVIIDLHEAPGSQNGFDNSGQRMPYPTLADMFKDMPTVVPIISPLNEPAGFLGDDIVKATRQFWYDSYGQIRYPYGSSRQSDTVELIHDAFQSLDYWNGFLAYPAYEGVMMDTHVYQIFSVGENQMSNQQHIASICAKQRSLASFGLWIVVREWAPVATDCTRYINGRGIGSRYDGSYTGAPRVGSCAGLTGRASAFSAAYKTFLRQFWEAQVITYEKGSGWLQWTWKAESADEWSYQAGLANGWIPQNPTDYKYPNICG